MEDDFHVWLEHRKYVPTLKAFKKKLTQIENFDEDWELETGPDRMAQKLTGQIAAYLRSNPKEADKTVALLNEVFQLSPENYS